VQRRWPEAHGTVAPAKGGGSSGVTEEGERPRVGQLGLDWVVLAGLQLGRFWNFQRRAAGKILSNFSNKYFILKAKDSNTFIPNLNWNQTGIN
jgi:hypothetical protein